jgi:predicted amidohydrolase YtcJ
LRQTLDGAPPDGWLPAERLTIEQSIAGYTRDAAVAGRLERTEGSIEPAKVADLILLSDDILTAPADAVARTRVLVTIAGGAVVHDAR